jgi:hypothetical protein
VPAVRQIAEALALGWQRRDVDSGRRLAAMDVRGDEVLLGRPLVMTKANIDQYDF